MDLEPQEQGLDDRLKRIEGEIGATNYLVSELADQLGEALTLLTQIAGAIEEIRQRVPDGER